METELLSHFRCSHRIREILLIRKDEYHRVPHLIFIQHLCELFTCILDTITVVAVDHKDEPLCASVVVSPQWADLVLAADIPYSEADVLVLDSLHIETYRRDSCDHFTKFQFVKNCRFASSIEAHHQNAHLLV